MSILGIPEKPVPPEDVVEEMKKELITLEKYIAKRRAKLQYLLDHPDVITWINMNRKDQYANELESFTTQMSTLRLPKRYSSDDDVDKSIN